MSSAFSLEVRGEFTLVKLLRLETVGHVFVLASGVFGIYCRCINFLVWCMVYVMCSDCNFVQVFVLCF